MLYKFSGHPCSRLAKGCLNVQTVVSFDKPMTVQVLQNEQRIKLDQNDDVLFYSEPRFVHHLDQSFRERLTRLYKQRIPASATVLDLMSSWVSHLPRDVSYDRVIGHGLNEKELAENKRLDSHWVQNLNLDQQIPLKDESIDVNLIVAGWQYLQQPEDVAAELFRITRPKGQIIVAFSNRAFWQKAPQIWTDHNDRDHLEYVGRVLMAQGWETPRFIAEETKAPGLLGLLGGNGDPFFAVISSKPKHLDCSKQ